jgi:hypothetical protein
LIFTILSLSPDLNLIKSNKVNRAPLFVTASAAVIIVLLCTIPLSALGAGYIQGYVRNDAAAPIEGPDIVTD